MRNRLRRSTEELANAINPYLLDEFPGASLLFSRFQRYSDYLGPLFDAYNVGTSTPLPIDPLPNGDADWDAAVDHVAGNDGILSTWYDQSGFGGFVNDDVAAPFFALGGSLLLNSDNEPGVEFDGDDNEYADINLVPGLDAITSFDPLSVFFKFEVLNDNGNGTANRTFVQLCRGGGGPRFRVFYRNRNDRLRIRVDSQNVDIFPGIASTVTVAYIYSGGTQTVWANGVQIDQRSFAVNNGWQTDFIFGENNFQGRTYRIDEFLVFNQDLTAARADIERLLNFS